MRSTETFMKTTNEIAEAAAAEGRAARAERAARFKAAVLVKPPPTPRVLTAAEVAAQGRQLAALEVAVASLKADAPAPPAAVVPDAPRHVSDHVGHALGSFSESNRAEHLRAVAYMEKANLQGKTPSYREALLAISRRRPS